MYGHSMLAWNIAKKGKNRSIGINNLHLYFSLQAFTWH